MSYYSSPKKYENATGKRFTTDCPSIHRTGSVRGMVKLGYWSEDSDKVRNGNYIYQQPWINVFQRGRKLWEVFQVR